MSYATIKYNYQHKLWSKEIVALAVKKGVITAVQYEEIVGEPYPV